MEYVIAIVIIAALAGAWYKREKIKEWINFRR